MKKNKFINKLPLVFSLFTFIASAITAPTVINLPDGGQTNVSISNSETNLFTIPGDKIIAVNSPNGILIVGQNLKNTSNGGIVFTPFAKKPFTFIIETEKGHNFSIRAVPSERVGRTIQIVSGLSGRNDQAKVWEQAKPYEISLVNINKEIINGQLPPGYSVIPVTTEKLPTPLGLNAIAERVWLGSQFKVILFTVTNNSNSTISIKESDFWQKETRSIMFSQLVTELQAGRKIQVYVTTGRGNNGQY